MIVIISSNSQRMRLIDYFDRLYIIHLPERTDRYQALSRELARIGIRIDSPKVRIPEAPRPQEPNGFPSAGVYGNFLSHLGILQESLRDGLERVWILEDDAIFRHRLRRSEEQMQLVDRLLQNDWDLCYLGHAIKPADLRPYPHGLVQWNQYFIWAHCYCVHARILRPLVAYLEETLTNPPGDPRGGRLYIDGAFTLFRQFHPEVVCLVSNPNLSNQRGSPSSLAGGHWYDNLALTKPLISLARSVRDELWRLSG